MVTLEGRTLRAGVAAAVAAVVDARHGMAGVSPALLAEGAKALKAMLPIQDYPEAVVVCDTAALGLSVRIPGVNTVGVAAESDADAPGLDPQVPCVVGLANLLRTVREGDMVIIDGGKGIVHIDPDLDTIVHYQQIEQQATTGSPVYIGAEHLPARTPDGEIVAVYAYVTEKDELAAALDQGADGVIVSRPGWESGSYDDLVEIMRSAAGKPIAFEVGDTVEQILRAAMRFAAPNQVALLFGASVFDSAVEKTNRALELLIAEALFEDIAPPRVRLGARTRDVERTGAVRTEPAVMLIDARESQLSSSAFDALQTQISAWIVDRRAEHTVILLGSRIDAVAHVVKAGVRAVAVDPDLVSAAKTAIREMASDQHAP